MFHLLRQGHSKHEAIAQSVQINLKAIFLTNVTTILGFLGMNFSESPPFRDMGNIVGLGVTVDLVNSILLLPALMAVLPVSASTGRESAHWIDFDRVASFVIRWRRLLLWSMLTAVALTSLGLLGIELDDNFLTYFDDSFEFRRATDFMTRNLGGWDVIEYSLSSGQSGGITDPAYMTVLDQFANWYRQQPKVVYVATLVDTLKRLNRDMHGGDPNYYRVPDQRELAAQYLLLYELSLPSGHDLNSHIDVDRSATRFTVILQSMSAKELCRMDEVAGQWLAAHAPSHVTTGGTGLSLIWARITRRNIGSMLLASVIEIVTISGIMLFSIRSLKFTALFLVPNLVPPFIAFGLWGMTKGRVGLALSVVVAMTLGIIVDDTIHFFVKYFTARREHGMTPEQAVRHAFGTVVAAIGVTTLVLISGFLVMMLSHYRMSAEMGLMCAMVIGLALVSDFFLTPALLMKFDRPADTLKHG
jgi:predicted RND superfamily exporter protein